jgi:outer membrane protein TolC
LFIEAQSENITDSVTLQEALMRVTTSYPAISEAQSHIRAAKTGIEQSKSLYYPSVKAVAQYTRIHPVSIFGGPGQSAITLFPPNNYNFEVTANWTVFDFGRRSLNVRATCIRYVNALDEAQRTKLDIALQTVETFNAIRMLQARIEVLEDEISLLHKHEHIACILEQSGSVTQLDVLTAQVRITGVENERIQADAMLKGQAIRLIELMGLDDSIVYASGVFSLPSEIPDGRALLDTAFKYLPEVALARDALRSAQL